MTVSDGIGRAYSFFGRAFRQKALHWQEQKQ
jgi:hypothetical protein